MGSFWQIDTGTVVGAIIMLVLGIILAKPLEALINRFGKWLDGFLQSLGFGFQKRYYRALINGHQWLKLIGIYNPSDLHAPRLKEVYISLKLNTAKESPTVVWNRIFNDKEKHLVVLGQPGAGKSTLLDYFTLIFTGHINHSLRADLKNPLPIFVRLRDLGTQSLLKWIESPENVSLKKIPAGYFDRHLKSGKCVVFLDGLDEVLDETTHKQVVSEILSFTNEYPDNWIVVTCRVAGWHDQLPAFRQYSVQEFDRDNVRQFIGAWYREVTRTEEINRLGALPKPELIRESEERAYQVSLKQAENLWGALLKNESLLRIARTPLIISLVTLVHKNRTADLPKGRARLYRECLDILLDIWDSKDKGIALPDAPSPNDKLLALKTIAFHYVEHGLLEMDIDGLESLVAPLLPLLTKKVSAKSLIKQIYERSGVLVEQAIGKYGFAHRALHDYLAAKYIEENSLDALLLDHAAEERWREVILIAIGLVQPQTRAETLLASLLRRSDENPASLALAGWSLAEDIQITEGLRNSVRIKILSEIDNVQTAGDFSLLSGALFDVDPDAMQSWIVSTLSGRDPDLQKRVLTSLIPNLDLEQNKPFLPLVRTFLSDSRSLAQLNPSRDSELWNALQIARKHEDLSLRSAATWAYCELGRYAELGLVKIPAGEFLMGGSDNEKLYTFFLPDYYISRNLVTVDEYRTFIQESEYKTTNKGSLKGTGNHPVAYLTWKDAFAFAQWKGLTLPSEAEWEKAARGTDGRIYPWGNEWQNELANTDEYWSGTRGWWRRLLQLEIKSTTTPVGFFSPRGDSPYGCADMSGNVWEWTRSAQKDYPYISNDRHENTNAFKEREIRGGSFSDYQDAARCAVRGANYFFFTLDSNIGFRMCASPNLS